MDLEEWEFVADDGFLEFHGDGGKKLFSGKYGMGRATSPRNVFNMDYFRCPSPKSPQFVDFTEEESVSPQKQLIPLSVQLDDPVMDHPNIVVSSIATNIPVVMDYPDIVVSDLTTNIPVVIPATVASNEPAETGAWEAEQDPVFQVFFKKMKENEFVDMKMDSPKSDSRGFFHQIEAGVLQFEEKSDQTWKDEDVEGKINNNSPRKVKADHQKEEEEITWEESKEEEMNLWKRVGTICSFGMAAATICIIIFSNGQKNKHNQKLRFQIYSDDKRIKQVVEQATKLNEAISSAVRGVPLTRAHITSGGYYEGL